MVAPSEAPSRAIPGKQTEPVSLSSWLAGGPPPDRGPGAAVVRHGVRPRADAVKAARRFTAATLRDWDLARLSGMAELVISELVTNALRHGLADRDETPDGRMEAPCPVELILLSHSPDVTCVVTDPSAAGPVRRDPGELADSGRGLQVVCAFSRDWGWSRLERGGKAVWALLHDG